MKRYNEIFTIRKPLFTKNAPVVVGKVSVFYDSEKKRRIVLCKIQNLCEKTITRANVLLKFYDKERHNLGEGLAYEYQNLHVSQGEIFGEKVLIKTNVKGVYCAVAIVTDVIFEDGSSWQTKADDKWEFLKPPTPIAKVLTSKYHLCAYKSQFGKKRDLLMRKEMAFRYALAER